jgi:type IV pilus assembly protein PilP
MMKRRSTLMIAFAATLLALTIGATLIAQTAPGGGASTTTGSTAAQTSTNRSVQETLEEILEEPSSADTYRYDPQGRRDPFQSLVGPTPVLKPGQRPAGTPGFLIDEMKLQGVVRSKQGLVAMVSGPDNKGYLLHVNDKVFDGEVIRITQTSVVFRQAVNDPTQIERFREVVKDLTPTTAEKQQ